MCVLVNLCYELVALVSWSLWFIGLRYAFSLGCWCFKWIWLTCWFVCILLVRRFADW